MINLGIVVLYAVPEWYEDMLALHLRQIAKHTHVPYTIFGCGLRISSNALRILEFYPTVRLCECSPATSTGSEEHSHYLNQLTKFAIDSGATHVVTLHVDSFPIHGDWIETMMSKLSDNCPLITGEGIDTGCLMFTKDFYLRYRPTFLPTDTERNRPEYIQCVSEWNLIQHSGVGYAFRAYQHGLTGYYMPRVYGRNGLALIYVERVFHGAGMFRSIWPVPSEALGLWYSRAWLLTAACHFVRAIVPIKIRQSLRRWLGRKTMAWIDDPRRALTGRKKNREMENLLANPEEYLARLLAQSDG